MNKQSSIDWFLSEFEKQIQFRPDSELDVWFKELFPKAKAMHREEIIEAHGVKESHGAEGSRNLWQQITGEQYYTENYEREDNKH
jgi:hypothetical protein